MCDDLIRGPQTWRFNSHAARQAASGRRRGGGLPALFTLHCGSVRTTLVHLIYIPPWFEASNPQAMNVISPIIHNFIAKEWSVQIQWPSDYGCSLNCSPMQYVLCMGVWRKGKYSGCPIHLNCWLTSKVWLLRNKDVRNLTLGYGLELPLFIFLHNKDIICYFIVS